MPASGSSIFTDADGYQASLRDLLDLLVLRPRDFHARLTWVELLHLHLLYAEEAASRLAYVTLPPEQVFIIFPTRQDSLLIAGVTGRASEGRFHASVTLRRSTDAGNNRCGASTLPPLWRSTRTFSQTSEPEASGLLDGCEPPHLCLGSQRTTGSFRARQARRKGQ